MVVCNGFSNALVHIQKVWKTSVKSDRALHASSSTNRKFVSYGLHRRNWKPDVVYLYQFYRRIEFIPNVSPFCLKVETFLRAHGIKYEPINCIFLRSKHGLLPFVELNGEHIADSQIILQRLQREFNIKDNLPESKRGMARAIDRMLEGSTSNILLHFKAVENAVNMLNPNCTGIYLPNLVVKIIAKLLSDKNRKRLHNCGLYGLSRDDMIDILRKDIQAVDDVLGDQKFLFGDRPTTPDFTVFAHLATTYFLPYRQPISDILCEEFPRVKALVKRMRLHYFPEWKFI